MLTERKRGRARKRHLLGWGQRRDRNHPGAWRYATPPASGGLCRPEVGVPWRPVPSARMAVSLPCGVMRGSRDAPPAGLRPAVPTGGRRGGRCRPPPGELARGRRSRACRAVSSVGIRAETGAIPTIGSSPPRPFGPLCRPPPGELARGRPFQAYAPRAEPGVSLYRLSASDAGRVHRSGSRCPRSTTPYHGSRNPYRFRSASRLSIQREPNRTRLPNRKLFAPDGE